MTNFHNIAFHWRAKWLWDTLCKVLKSNEKQLSAESRSERNTSKENGQRIQKNWRKTEEQLKLDSDRFQCTIFCSLFPNDDLLIFGKIHWWFCKTTNRFLFLSRFETMKLFNDKGLRQLKHESLCASQRFNRKHIGRCALYALNDQRNLFHSHYSKSFWAFIVAENNCGTLMIGFFLEWNLLRSSCKKIVTFGWEFFCRLWRGQDSLAL